MNLRNAIFTAFAILVAGTVLQAQSIYAAEYFIDTDPGQGSGTSIDVTEGGTINETVDIPVETIAALSDGTHRLVCRVRDSDGDWSVAFTRSFLKSNFTVDPTVPNIVSGEYFIDTDPGQGSGIPFDLEDATTVAQAVSIPVETIAVLDDGFHRLVVRVLDDRGNWSTAFTRVFNKSNFSYDSTVPDVVEGEYFFNVDPGEGNGTSFSVTDASDINKAVNIPPETIADLDDGHHRLVVRLKDANGNWSSPQTRVFLKQPDPLPPCPPPTIDRIEYRWLLDGQPVCETFTLSPGEPASIAAFMEHASLAGLQPGQTAVLEAIAYDNPGEGCEPGIGRSVAGYASVLIEVVPELLDQVIAFNSLEDRTFLDDPFTLTASSSSGLPVSLSIDSGPGILEGSTVTITGAGTIMVRVLQGGNECYKPVDILVPITVHKAEQAISFETPNDRIFGDEPFDLAATASSDLPVAFAIDSGPATLDGTLLTITAAGEISVRATQAGNGNYLPASDVVRTFTVQKADQTIDFIPPADRTFVDSPVGLHATATSGLDVIFAIDSGPAIVDGTTLTITGVGEVFVRASQAGNGNYNPADDVVQSFTISKADQEIAFDALADRTYTEVPFELSASASSGLGVAFSIDSGPALLDGTTLTITGVGEVFVRATQAGNENYNPAGDLVRSFIVSKADQVIVFGALEDRTFGDDPISLSGTASSGLPLSFSVDSGPANVDADILTITGAGSISVRASQQGNDNYNPAEDVVRSFSVAKADQVITFEAPAGITFGDDPVSLSGSASSSLPLSFSLDSGPATVDGNILSITGAGEVTLRASQGGDDNYNPAEDVVRSLDVAMAAQLISFDAPPDISFTRDLVPLQATASSELEVTFAIDSGPASISGSSLTLTGVGEVTVRALQEGDSDYLPADDVVHSFLVSKADQTITFPTPLQATFGDEPILLSPTASSDLEVAIVVDSGPGELDGNLLTISGAGLLTLRAAQAGDDNFNPAQDVIKLIPVLKAEQEIMFDPPEGLTFGDEPVELAGSASSGLPVAYSISEGPASIEGNTLIIEGAGALIIRASQDGNVNFSAAEDVLHTVVVGKADQAITFQPPSNVYVGTGEVNLEASASSGLPVLIELVSGTAALNGFLLTFDSVGTLSLTASQGGNDNYKAAPVVERTINILTWRQTWLKLHFTNEQLANPLVSGDTVDLSGDGIPNLLCYAFGLDPWQNNKQTVPRAAFGPDRILEFAFARDTRADDLIYVALVSSSLGAWEEITRIEGGSSPAGSGSPVEEPETGAGLRSVTVVDPAGPVTNNMRVVRLTVTRVPE